MLKLHIHTPCSLILAFICFFSSFSALAQAQENLISNADFEKGESPWVMDNWANNVANMALDESNPHSGKFSLRVRLEKIVGTPDLMISYPKLAVKPGMGLKIRFWARGISNVSSLAVILRKGGAPYTSYFRAEVGLTDEWQEYVYTTLLPTDFDPSDLSLRLDTRAVGVFWIDDVVVTELPTVEEGAAPTVNPIRNPSFEAGTDGWVAMTREREFKEMWQEAGGNSPAPDDANLQTTSDNSTPHGRNYLTFRVGENCFQVLTSSFFHARYGRKLRLNFSLRSDGKHTFQAGIGGGKNGNASFQLVHQTSTDQWQAYSLPFTLKPSYMGLFNLRFDFNEPGRYDIDSVSIVEDDQPAPLLYPPSFAIKASAQAPIGNLYSPGERATFDLVVANEKPKSKLTYQVIVYDYFDREKARFDISVNTDADGYAQQPFTVPTNLLGGFRIEARNASKALLAEQLYSVLPSIPAPAERPDSFFGGHIDLTPYNLEIARKGGFRWIRLYQPLNTLWMAVQLTPEDGWNFKTADVARAHKQGFKILSTFNTVPNFAADMDPQKPVRTRWRNSYPPADMNAWKNYVTKCFEAFGPYSDAWELWNEPDGGYLQVKPGLNKADVYMALLKATREALDATKKPYYLMGPASASINAPLAWELLGLGAGKQFDAYSFHYYSLSAGGDSPDEKFILPILDRYRTYQNRNGETLPLWHTEGGIYLAGSKSWLETYNIPPSSIITPTQGAASMVRAALLFKSKGVKRYFDYQAAASPTGRRINEDITCGFIDVTGIPSPGIAAHAAMVWLTEDATPAGFDILPGKQRVKVAHFKGAKGNIDVYWSGEKISLKEVGALGAKDEVRDIMGNPISRDTAEVGEFPLYVIRSALQK